MRFLRRLLCTFGWHAKMVSAKLGRLVACEACGSAFIQL